MFKRKSTDVQVKKGVVVVSDVSMAGHRRMLAEALMLLATWLIRPQDF